MISKKYFLSGQYIPLYAEEYSERSQTSKIDLFATIIKQVKAVNNFRKKLRPRYLAGVRISMELLCIQHTLSAIFCCNTFQCLKRCFENQQYAFVTVFQTCKKD